MKCKICKNQLDCPGTIPGYVSGEFFAIYYCQCCGASQADVREDYDFGGLYNAIYAQNSVDGYARYHEYSTTIKSIPDALGFLAEKEPQYNAVRNVINKIDKKASVLEIGSGLGYTTYALRKSGYENAWGCDLSVEAVNKSIETFGNYYLLPEAAYARKYDFVFATEVIEHCPDPQAFLEQCLGLLKDGGMLLVTTPRSTVPALKMQNLNNMWISDPPPVHLWCLTPNSLSQILEAAGGKDVVEVAASNKRSLFKTIAMRTSRGHVINVGCSGEDDKKTKTFTRLLKSFVKKSAPGFAGLDLKYLYARAANCLTSSDLYVFVPVEDSEVIAMTCKK